MIKKTKKINIQNAEYVEKIKNLISSLGEIEFSAESDEGIDILYDISINNKNISDPLLKEIIREIHWENLGVQEGRGIIFMKGNKINLKWTLELHINSFAEINEIFFQELSDVLSIPKEWDISWLMNCQFEFEGEMKKRNKIDFQKFIFSVHLCDYKDSIEDVSKKEINKFEKGYAFHPDENFQIEMKNMISKLILSSGLKKCRFIISGDNSLTFFSVYPNESKTYELTLN
jgi:hypothetical protein